MKTVSSGVGSKQQLARQACQQIRALDRQLLAYAELDEALVDLIKRPRHEVVVPISEVAFVPGEIVDTNCILALIGDQTFIEKSNDGARKLVDRRCQRLEQQRGELLPLLEEQVVDIREEYVEESDDVQQTRPSTPAALSNDKKLPEQSESFEQFWERLGNRDLEVEEERHNSSSKPVTQLHGFFSQQSKPKSSVSSSIAANPTIITPSPNQNSASTSDAANELIGGNRAPRKLSRFKAQRQNLNSN